MSVDQCFEQRISGVQIVNNRQSGCEIVRHLVHLPPARDWNKKSLDASLRREFSYVYSVVKRLERASNSQYSNDRQSTPEVFLKNRAA